MNQRDLAHAAQGYLAWHQNVPQWRCKNGHWNNVSLIVQRCYACCDTPRWCEPCGGDGGFDEAGSERHIECTACLGWGMEWDWPNDDAPVPAANPADQIAF